MVSILQRVCWWVSVDCGFQFTMSFGFDGEFGFAMALMVVSILRRWWVSVHFGFGFAMGLMGVSVLWWL